MENTEGFCRNCGAQILDEYCGVCGQREGRGDLHLREAAGDVVGDIFTWDSRLWRTLFSLVLRPGFLTAEFIAGRRARYMPPFRLYIVISFLMFLVLSLSAGDVILVGGSDADDVDSNVLVGLDPNRVSDELGAQGDLVVKESKEAQSVDDAERIEAGSLVNDAEKVSTFSFDLNEDSPAWLKQLEARLESNADRVSDDPGDYVRELLEYLPQMMFLMLPLFAGLLRLAYLFSPFHYLQHLVFALHYHSFVYLLYLFSAGLELVNRNLDGLTALLMLVYLLFALRRAFGSAWAGAIGKSVALCISYGLLLVFGMATAALAVLAAM